MVELRELGFGGLRIDDIIERTEGRLRLREWLGLHRRSAAWACNLRGGLESLEFAAAYARALGHRGLAMGLMMLRRADASGERSRRWSAEVK